jgi:hypothetical protein
MSTKVLISGAGIAGLTLAYWLRRYGFRPTVLEHAPALREGGYMIDFFGVGYDVAEKMSLRHQLEQHDVRIHEIAFVDADNRRVGGFDADGIRALLDPCACNILRSSLSKIIYETLPSDIEIDSAIRYAPSSTSVRASTSNSRADRRAASTWSSAPMVCIRTCARSSSAKRRASKTIMDIIRRRSPSRTISTASPGSPAIPRRESRPAYIRSGTIAWRRSSCSRKRIDCPTIGAISRRRSPFFATYSRPKVGFVRSCSIESVWRPISISIRSARFEWIVGSKAGSRSSATLAVALRSCRGRARLAMAGAYVLAGELKRRAGAVPGPIASTAARGVGFVVATAMSAVKKANARAAAVRFSSVGARPRPQHFAACRGMADAQARALTTSVNDNQ